LPYILSRVEGAGLPSGLGCVGVSRRYAGLSVQHCVCLELILPAGQRRVPVSGQQYSQLMVYEVIRGREDAMQVLISNTFSGRKFV